MFGAYVISNNMEFFPDNQIVRRHHTIMNIWRCELTDARSIRIRFVLSLLWSFPLLVGIWWYDRSVTTAAILAVVFCYMSVVELVLDRWRLKHPDAAMQAERRLRLLGVLPAILGSLLAVIFFT